MYTKNEKYYLFSYSFSTSSGAFKIVFFPSSNLNHYFLVWRLADDEMFKVNDYVMYKYNRNDQKFPPTSGGWSYSDKTQKYYADYDIYVDNYEYDTFFEVTPYF